MIQFKVDGNGTVYFDNFFYGVNASPTAGPAAPGLMHLMSLIFSDSYTAVTADTNPNWGQSTVVTVEDLVEMMFSNMKLNYQGTDWASEARCFNTHPRSFCFGLRRLPNLNFT